MVLPKKINKNYKPLARLTKILKREDTNHQYQEWNGDITTDPTALKKEIKDYYEQLYSHKFNNLEKMEQFLQNYKVTKLNQYEIDNLNSPVTFKVIEFVIKILLKKSPPGPDGSTGEFYLTFKE